MAHPVPHLPPPAAPSLMGGESEGPRTRSATPGTRLTLWAKPDRQCSLTAVRQPLGTRF